MDGVHHYLPTSTHFLLFDQGITRILLLRIRLNKGILKTCNNVSRYNSGVWNEKHCKCALMVATAPLGSLTFVPGGSKAFGIHVSQLSQTACINEVVLGSHPFSRHYYTLMLSWVYQVQILDTPIRFNFNEYQYLTTGILTPPHCPVRSWSFR